MSAKEAIRFKYLSNQLSKAEKQQIILRLLDKPDDDIVTKALFKYFIDRIILEKINKKNQEEWIYFTIIFIFSFIIVFLLNLIILLLLMNIFQNTFLIFFHKFSDYSLYQFAF